MNQLKTVQGIMMIDQKLQKKRNLLHCYRYHRLVHCYHTIYESKFRSEIITFINFVIMKSGGSKYVAFILPKLASVSFVGFEDLEIIGNMMIPGDEYVITIPLLLCIL